MKERWRREKVLIRVRLKRRVAVLVSGGEYEEKVEKRQVSH